MWLIYLKNHVKLYFEKHKMEKNKHLTTQHKKFIISILIATVFSC